jgi:hypothetical protein
VQLSSIVWFLRVGILFSLKMVSHVLQHVGEANLMFVVLIKKVHFAAIINGVRLCTTVSFDMKVLFWTMYFVCL